MRKFKVCESCYRFEPIFRKKELIGRRYSCASDSIFYTEEQYGILELPHDCELSLEHIVLQDEKQVADG